MSHELVLACVLAAPIWAAETTASEREKLLLDRIERLEKRVAELEKRTGSPMPAPATEPLAAAPAVAVSARPPAPPVPPASDWLRSTTVNFQVDAYYGYNFNSPIGRANLLRTYDVLANAFSLNQASVVIEKAPDLAAGTPFGARLDLQWGQATQTLQGNPANELRPDIYRAIFQAYGTYIAPIGKGLTLDFGKWASSIGIEDNYTKDQINYSRSLWFAYLPFYHMGVRANYKINDQVSLNYWITNGTQQTEPFSGFKDQLVGLNLQPRKNLAWTINYYLGQEHPDVVVFPNALPGSLPGLPTLQGVPFEPVLNPPHGHLDILDSYATVQASRKWLFALEGDYVIQRLYTNSAPAYTYGGAGYARYQLTPRLALGGRAEYMADHGGLFSGIPQVLREGTFTTEYKLGEGFLTRLEYRRDFSNQHYFLSDTLGLLKKEQTTATIGLVWWFGPKQGAW